jgi:hypothetical protein
VTDSTLTPDREWPYRPDFNQFKRQAKELIKAYRAGDAKAVAEVQRHERTPDPVAFALHDAQRVLARSYGFPSWPKLKSYVQTLQPYWRPMEPKSDDDVNKFLRLACITYFDGDHPSRRDRARQLLAASPNRSESDLTHMLKDRTLGNALALSGVLYERWFRGQPLPDFNLDSDRGYGYPCWTQVGDPPHEPTPLVSNTSAADPTEVRLEVLP